MRSIGSPNLYCDIWKGLTECAVIAVGGSG